MLPRAMKRDERPGQVDESRPRLVWPGKPAVSKRSLRPRAPLAVTEHLGPTPAEGTARNKLVHADNREAIPALLGELEGRVDLVYIDPPFATGG